MPLDDDEIAGVFRAARSVAIVGVSDDRDRAGNVAYRYMKGEGYDVAGVNPNVPVVDGDPVYAALPDVPFEPDVVVVYRRAEFTAEVARDALARGAKVVWLPLGVESDQTRALVEAAGKGYVQDRCVYTTHRLMKRMGML